MDSFSSCVLIKPDAYRRGLVGYCIAVFEARFKVNRLSVWHPNGETSYKLREHYKEHEGKDFYEDLIDFMQSGPFVAMAVGSGDTYDIRDAATQLRRRFADMVRGPANLVHSSDSSTSAIREMSIWFPGAYDN